MAENFRSSEKINELNVAMSLWYVNFISASQNNK